MNTIANNIKQRMSLREPLCKALDVVVRLTDELCKDFERDFPSFAFSIATGIGKTRLMGARIAYLFQKKGVRHFFVLAPNLTLYEKLIRDFGDPSYEKYVCSKDSRIVSVVSKAATKPWRYVLIAHSAVSRTMQFDYLTAKQ